MHQEGFSFKRSFTCIKQSFGPKTKGYEIHKRNIVLTAMFFFPSVEVLVIKQSFAFGE
jgi:hypothetical protein